MRSSLIAWLILSCAFVNAFAGERPLVVHEGAVLQWVDNNPPGTAAHYIVQVYLGEKLMASEPVDETKIAFKVLLSELIPGEYQLHIVTVDQNGVASAPSAAMTILWVGSGLG